MTPSTIPTTRQRFKGAIAAAPTLDTAAGICQAIHKAELLEIFEELEGASNSAEVFLALERLKQEYCP